MNSKCNRARQQHSNNAIFTQNLQDYLVWRPQTLPRPASGACRLPRNYEGLLCNTKDYYAIIILHSLTEYAKQYQNSASWDTVDLPYYNMHHA